MDEFEIYYIEHLNSYAPNGYNQTHGGDAGVTGYKFTEKQRQHTSENSKRRAADGRYTIYCYDIINKQYITEVNIPALAIRLSINIDSSDIRNITCKSQYILARSKEKLEEKIKIFKEKLNSNSNSGRFKKDPRADKIIEDIKGGMTCAAFMCKYHMCKKTYYTYKNTARKMEVFSLAYESPRIILDFL